MILLRFFWKTQWPNNLFCLIQQPTLMKSINICFFSRTFEFFPLFCLVLLTFIKIYPVIYFSAHSSFVKGKQILITTELILSHTLVMILFFKSTIYYRFHLFVKTPLLFSCFFFSVNNDVYFQVSSRRQESAFQRSLYSRQFTLISNTHILVQVKIKMPKPS